MYYINYTCILEKYICISNIYIYIYIQINKRAYFYLKNTNEVKNMINVRVIHVFKYYK